MKQTKNNKGVWLLVLFCFLLVKSGVTFAEEKRSDKKNSSTEKKITSDESDIQSFGIRVNDLTNSRNKIELNSFYQQERGGEFDGWTVNSLKASVFSRYAYFDFSADLGTLTSSKDDFQDKATSHRFGLQLHQFYIKNNGIGYFGAHIGTNHPFPVILANGGYSRDIGRLGRGSAELNEIFFGQDESYLTLAASISKRISNHQLTIKPFYSRALYNKLNLILTDQFYFSDNASCLILKMVSGYYPDSNTFINYDRVDDGLFRISVEGELELSKLQTALLPVAGCDYFKDGKGNYQTSWYIQFGFRILL